MIRVLMIMLLAVGFTQSAAAHKTTWNWPHQEDDAGSVHPVELDRFDAMGGDFALPDPEGRIVHLSDYRGKVVLMFFGYTFCPDACPAVVARVTQAMQLLGEQRQQVQFLFISTDPERDTPKHLKEWLVGFDSRFVGLRGSSAELSALEKRYYSYHEKLPQDSKTGAYLVGHTSRLFLIDQQGVVRYMFAKDQPASSIAEGVGLLLDPNSWWARFRVWLTG